MKLKKNRISSVYRKRKDRRLILNITAVVTVLILSIVLTAAYGNSLKDKAASFDDTPPPELPKDTLASTGEVAAPAREISTLYVPADAFASKESFDAALASVPEDCTALSLYLYTANGGPRWNASSSALLSVASGSSTLTAPDMFAALKARGIYSSAVFESRALTAALAPAERAAVSAYEHLLITELVASGCNEILLFNSLITADTVASVLEYCADLRAVCSDITIGISLARGADVSADGSVIYTRLASSLDFLCLDLTASLAADLNNTFDPLLPPDGTAEPEGGNGENAAADPFPTLRETVEYELLHISRYEMRVLLRIPEGAPIEGCSTVLLPFLADLSVHSASLIAEQ